MGAQNFLMCPRILKPFKNIGLLNVVTAAPYVTQLYRRKSREKNDGPTQSTNNFEGVTTCSRENTARNNRDGGKGRGLKIKI